METLARAANRGSIATGAAYEIDYSLKNESANGERFQTGNLFTNYSSTQTYTFSMWVKRTEISNRGYILNFQANTGISVYLNFAADSSTQALYYLFQTSGTVYAYGKTTAVYRDTSAWYHIVFRVDTTQATAADRVRIYVNGVQQDLESGGNGHPAYPSQNYNVPLQQQQYLLGYDGGNNGFSGYCADYYFIDGQSLAPTEFGEFDSATGIWKPIEYQGTFGNEGYYLDFADASALGKDVSPNNQGNFTHYGGSSADQATDTPTNNFCTYNPVADFRQRDLTGFKNGGTQITHTDESQWCGGVCTMGVTRGKWYWEIQQYDTDDILFGVHTFTGDVGSNTAPHLIDNSWYYYGGGGSGSYWVSYINGTATSNSANRGTVWSAGNIIGFALNLDDDEFTFYVNGGSAGASNTNVDISSLTALGLPLIPFIGMWRSAVNLNFGGFTMTSISSGNTDANGYGNFEYAPPTGYYALCSKNLAEFG